MPDSEVTGPEEKSNSSSAKLGKWPIRIILISFGLIGLFCFIVFLFLGSEYTRRENVFLAVAGFLASGLISYYLGDYFGSIQTDKAMEKELDRAKEEQNERINHLTEKQEEGAIKAIRRSADIKYTAHSLKGEIARIIKTYKERDEYKDMIITMRSIDRIMSILLRQADSAIDDWGDIVPEKIQEIRNIEQEAIDLQNDLYIKIMLAEEALSELDARKQEKERIISEYNQNISELRRKAISMSIPPSAFSGEATLDHFATARASINDFSITYDDNNPSPFKIVGGPIILNSEVTCSNGDEDQED